MDRNLTRLSSEHFDLAVIGGGILGACVAWDAAARGLSVALIERTDFGSGTTAGSGKVIHGGLRHLHHFGFGLAREACREQATLWRLAPKLLRPMAFAVPASRQRWQDSLPLMAGAYAWRGFRAVFGTPEPLAAPRYLAGPNADELDSMRRILGLRSALLYSDFQIRSPERLTLAFADAADTAGAAVANYLEATGLLVNEGHIQGVEVRDRLTGADFRVRASWVINAAGPWTPEIWRATRLTGVPIAFAKGMHLVVDQPEPNVAIALPWPELSTSPDTSSTRRVFVMPWEGRTLVGATYTPFGDAPDLCQPVAAEVDDFVTAVRERWPQLELLREQVLYAYAGLYPVFNRRSVVDAAYAASVRPLVIEHGSNDGPAGLISAVSVKLTTARRLAERLVDMVARRMTRRTGPCITGSSRDLRLAHLTIPGPHDATGRCAWNPTHLDQVVATAVKAEMAMTVSDVVFRRTMLGHHGHPGADVLQSIGESMATRLGWTPTQTTAEVRTANDVFDRMGLSAPETTP